MLIDRTGNVDWTEKKLAAVISLFHFSLWQLAHELNLANLDDQAKNFHLLSKKKWAVKIQVTTTFVAIIILLETQFNMPHNDI